jgi:hypothetical protein
MDFQKRYYTKRKFVSEETHERERALKKRWELRRNFFLSPKTFRIIDPFSILFGPQEVSAFDNKRSRL